MGGIAYTLPTIGNSDATEDPLVRNALSVLLTWANGNVDSGNLAAGAALANLADGSVPAAKIVNKSLSAAQTTDAFAKDNVEPAFSTYKTVIARSALDASQRTSGLWVLPGDASGAEPASPTLPGPVASVFYLDPADWTAGSRATKLRVRAELLVGPTAPATTLTFGLYPVASFATTGLSGPSINALGAVTAGSTVVFVTPGAFLSGQANSGDFTAPAAGWYVLAVSFTATAASNNRNFYRTTLQMRQV